MSDSNPTDPPPNPRAPLGAARWTRADGVVLAIVAAVALVHLPFPFTGDQALFTHASSGLRHGDTLYVDYWDLKQPGIYAWYTLVGSLFGFREVGIHAGEVVTLVGLARLTQVAARGAVTHRVLASAAPVFTVGAYLASARPWDLTQVEILVAVPMTALMALAGAPGPVTARRAAVAGALVGSVAWAKLLYAPIALVIAVRIARRSTDRVRAHGWVAGGLAAAVAPIVVGAAAYGIVGELWWTFVEYPAKIGSIDSPPLGRLRASVEFVARMHGWLAPLALVAWVRPLRARRSPAPPTEPRGSPVATDATVWLIGGWLLVLTQQWWGYHFFFMLVPLGLLATVGLDRLATASSGRAGLPAAVGRRGAIAVVGLTALWAVFPARELAHKIRSVVDDRGGVLRREWNPEYADVAVIVAPLSLAHHGEVPLDRAGPIHVLGNPLILYRSGRDAAIAQNGWSPEFWDERLWERQRTQLDVAIEHDAIAYLWVDRANAQLWQSRSFATWEWMRATFVPVATVADGTWYEPGRAG